MLDKAKIDTYFEDGVLYLDFSGNWRACDKRPSFYMVEEKLYTLRPKEVIIKTSSVPEGMWDSTFAAFVFKLYDFCTKANIPLNKSKMNRGLEDLIALALAVPEKDAADKKTAGYNLFENVGNMSIKIADNTYKSVEFVGECGIALCNIVRGKAKYRKSDVFSFMQQSGPEALAIVSLVSFLVGLILAFVGAVQLAKYGSEIFVADLVGLAMAREMGAMMTGVVMCGRTGAAFAAQIGSMKLSEEVDALKTFGFKPVEFLVMPRMIALFLMMPLLTIFADLVGILGGMTVAITMFDISIVQYISRTMASLDLTQCLTGIFKSVIFGAVIAAIGCLRGMQCGNSSEAVGFSTTSAVVTSITALIILDAIFAVIFQIVGI